MSSATTGVALNPEGFHPGRVVSAFRNVTGASWDSVIRSNLHQHSRLGAGQLPVIALSSVVVWKVKSVRGELRSLSCGFFSEHFLTVSVRFSKALNHFNRKKFKGVKEKFVLMKYVAP